MMGVKNMKKFISLLVSLLVFGSTLMLPSFATSKSTVISLVPTNTTVRIGDTITITGKFNGNAMVGTFNVYVKYNVTQLQYKSVEGISPSIKAGELDAVSSSGSIQLLYLDADGGETGILSANAFKLTFKVVGGNVGDTISVNTQVDTVGDVNVTEVETSVVAATMKIAAPLSTNNYLSSLSIDNGTLSPYFKKSVTTYNVSVPFTVSKLNVNAKAEDTNSKVSINNPTLTPNSTTNITVLVTAQNGAKKTYTIKVARAKDPNYQQSSNNYLSSITVNLSMLSPIFNKDVTSYVVWLPYETDNIVVAGTAENNKSTVSVIGGSNLEAGKDNTITLVCTAENGDVKTYTIIAKRASEDFSQTPTPTGTPTSLDIEKIKNEISVAQKSQVSKTVNVDLSNSGSKLLDNLFFNQLSSSKDVIVNINLGGAKIVFEGKETTVLSEQKTYDFSYVNNSQYKDIMIKDVGSENDIFTYSFAYHGDLQGFATFNIYTNFVSGDKVNVYKYDAEKPQYILIAQNITVGTGGVVTYINNSCSDYLITKNTIANALKSDVIAKQVLQNTSDDFLLNIVIFAVICVLILALGIFIGYNIKVNRTQNNII